MDLQTELLEKHGLTKTVYSYYFPETREIVENLWETIPHELYINAWTKKQDYIHIDFLDKWRNWVSPVVDINTQVLKFSYPTNGSSEAIRESIASHANMQRRLHREPVIHVLDGEYEGYEAVADAYKVKVIRHNRFNYKESILASYHCGDQFYISQPSAIDGNYWQDFEVFLAWMYTNACNVKIMVDLCYVGSTTTSKVINLDFPNIHTVFFSLSKIFGVYYHRIGGVFCREEMPGLYGNMWFKNLFSLTLGISLMQIFECNQLSKKYSDIQRKVISKLTENDIHLYASDVILLGNRILNYGSEIDLFMQRGCNVARYCLTPALAKEIENAND